MYKSMSTLESITESHTDKTNYAGRTIYQLSPLMIMLSRPGAAPPPACIHHTPVTPHIISWGTTSPDIVTRMLATCRVPVPRVPGLLMTNEGGRVCSLLWPGRGRVSPGAPPRACKIIFATRHFYLHWSGDTWHLARGTWPTAQGINSWGRGKITMSNFTDYSKEQWSQVIPVLPSLKVKLHPRGPLLRKWEREKMREKWPLSWCNYYNNLQFRLGPYAVTRQIFIQDVCIYQASMHAFIEPFIW